VTHKVTPFPALPPSPKYLFLPSLCTPLLVLQTFLTVSCILTATFWSQCMDYHIPTGTRRWCPLLCAVSVIFAFIRFHLKRNALISKTFLTVAVNMLLSNREVLATVFRRLQI
jgi:hypothetical protein